MKLSSVTKLFAAVGTAACLVACSEAPKPTEAQKEHSLKEIDKAIANKVGVSCQVDGEDEYFSAKEVKSRRPQFIREIKKGSELCDALTNG